MNNLTFYQADKHAEMITKWWKEWGMKFDASLIPSTGYVIEGICAGFLCETNTPICSIEHYVRNPQVDEKTANECLDYIGDKLLELAKEKGFKFVVCYSQHLAVAERAEKHGFKTQPQLYYCFGRSV